MKLNKRIQAAARSSKEFLGIRSGEPKPHFLGIGAQKGGTTTLYQILKKRKEIYLPNNKELHYFSKHFDLGESWYKRQFMDSLPGQLRGEITPYYLFHDEAPKRIYSFKSNILLIVLLRDPIERTISQYFHSIRLGLEDLSFEKAIEQEDIRLKDSQLVISKPGGTHHSHQEHSYIARSKYDIQLKRYLKFFRKDQLLILRSEDLFKRDSEALTSISDFFGIKPFDKDVIIPKENPGQGESIIVSAQLRQKIAKRLNPTYMWLDKELGINW